jgi:DedD protein
MEKKKLLLVAVSVGVVLLIIIGIPLLIIAPRQNYTPLAQTSFSTEADQDWFAARPNDFRITQPPAETVTELDIVQPTGNIIPPPLPETPHVTTITVPPPQTAAVPNAPVAVQVQQPSTIKLTSAKPAAAEKPVQEKPVPTKTVSAPKETVKTPSVTYNTYWVQTGAFTTKIYAEGAKESLASKGITSIIDNRDINGKTWYRVRVGPYTSETEAKYWLALVKSIDGFADSQIRQTTALR